MNIALYKKTALAVAIMLLVLLSFVPLVYAATAYGDSVFASAQGDRANGTNVLVERSNPDNALNVPDGDFFSLGFGGSITVEFADFVGTNLSIATHEVTNGSYPFETALVEVSVDGSDWTEVGTADNESGAGTNPHTTEFDLEDDTCIKFVRVTDTSNVELFEDTADGFDVDAVSAIYDETCEPPVEPPACPLDAAYGRTIVEFDGSKIYSNKLPHESGPVNTTLGDGKYKVTLVSYDNHTGQNPLPAQVNEQWHVVLEDGGSTVATSNSISDLPLDEDWRTETVQTDLLVSQDVDSVTAVHSYLHEGPPSNSIIPICAAFDKVKDKKKVIRYIHNDNDVVVNNSNDATVWNWVHADANTGKNDANGGDGEEGGDGGEGGDGAGNGGSGGSGGQGGSGGTGGDTGGGDPWSLWQNHILHSLYGNDAGTNNAGDGGNGGTGGNGGSGGDGGDTGSGDSGGVGGNGGSGGTIVTGDANVSAVITSLINQNRTRLGR